VTAAAPLVAVTDHAVERYRQRVRGALDARPEIAGRVAAAWAAGAWEAAPERGSVRVRDLERADLVYVCLHDRPRGELVVVTLWEEGEDAAVPRRFTDALRERRRPRGVAGPGGPSPGATTEPAPARASPRPAARPARLHRMRPYEGLLTAMVTPFAPDGSVDEATAVALGRHLLANGSHGLVICGTTGEAATMTDEEQIGLIATMVAELGSEGAIVAGTGSNDTRHATHLTDAAVGAGAHAILSVTPYYNKPNSRGVRRHFEEVARAASGRPVVLYNIPSRTALNMAPDFLAELATIDGVEAVKQANSDELNPVAGLAMIAGNDDALAACMDKGGVGGICVASHLVGPEMRRIVDEPDARAELDAALREIYAAMFVTASPAPVKAGLAMIGHAAGGLRLPLVEVDDAEREHVRAALAAHGLVREASAA